MGRIKNKDTGPEMKVRRLVHSWGYRYRLHDPRLPGKPDLVFASRRKAIFVHGCFWHLHKPCTHYKYPRSRLEFWGPKLEANKERDAANRRKLHRLNWDILVVWECQLRNQKALERTAERIRRFLEK